MEVREEGNKLSSIVKNSPAYHRGTKTETHITAWHDIVLDRKNSFNHSFLKQWHLRANWQCTDRSAEHFPLIFGNFHKKGRLWLSRSMHAPVASPSAAAATLCIKNTKKGWFVTWYSICRHFVRLMKLTSILLLAY